MVMEHTRGPLVSNEEQLGDIVTKIGGFRIAQAVGLPAHRTANAAEIVKRWNLHEELVELARAYTVHLGCGTMDHVNRRKYEAAVAILAKVDA